MTSARKAGRSLLCEARFGYCAIDHSLPCRYYPPMAGPVIPVLRKRCREVFFGSRAVRLFSVSRDRNKVMLLAALLGSSQAMVRHPLWGKIPQASALNSRLLNAPGPDAAAGGNGRLDERHSQLGESRFRAVA